MPRHSVSIDGPTASGKSTLATGLAERLGLAFLDTGLTYRAVGYSVSRDPGHPLRGRLGSALRHHPVVYDGSGKVTQKHTVSLEGEDITEELWNPLLEPHLKTVARDAAWRQEILRLHRRIIDECGDIVVVGRDAAMTLLPAAELNIYLTAGLAIRRERRRAQYRDRKDRSIAVGPPTDLDVENRAAVRALPRSLELDSTHLPASAVLTCVLRRLGHPVAPIDESAVLAGAPPKDRTP
ncbi:(d)CMP kinase [Streptomyces sp. NPDC005876]|uniref:(d)CMP kinase n=1 Tax=unclassified Streptomyces TaxID=2593676 RepID=UPI0034061497